MSMMMNDRQIQHVLRPYIATLATLRKDGSPHTAPVWYRYKDDAFFVLTDAGSQKHKNIMRDPRAELCIDDRERAPFHTVIVRGRATVLPHPGAEWRRMASGGGRTLSGRGARPPLRRVGRRRRRRDDPHQSGEDCGMVSCLLMMAPVAPLNAPSSDQRDEIAMMTKHGDAAGTRGHSVSSLPRPVRRA